VCPPLQRSRSDCRRGSVVGLIVVTRLLTVEEVAERLGVTKDWVWAQARAGRIPHVQLGRYRRFREEALERWLDELESSNSRNGRPESR
jgi:excisionase family DNA binding protein